MRVAVLASGRGSNFQSILDASERGKLPNCKIKLLIVNKKEAFAIERAKKHNVPYYIIESDNKKRDEFDLKMLEILKSNQIEIVVLAGFMRILSKQFISEYKDKIINIHPSLLPKFPGARAHRDAIEAKVKISGCTVHFVDEGVDTGPIIMQESVAVDRDDDEHTLSEKILPIEHKIYPKVLDLLTSNQIKIINGKVITETD